MSGEHNVPDIRFKGFNGKWDYLDLLDSIEKIIDFRGRTPKKLGLDWSASGYRALSALNVKQGYIDFTIDPHYGDQELYDRWMSGSELHQGQVLFTTEAPMGNVAQVPNSEKYILSQRTIAFVVKSEVVTEDFLAVLLRSPKIFRELSSLSSGGTAKGVSQKVLAKLRVSLPEELDEQTQIGNYFQKLDNLINQHQQKHDKLSSIKKAMLEKMFPKQGETIPEIRFKGFGGEWEEIGLLDSIERIIDFRGRTPKKLGLDWSPSGYRALSALNVKQGYIDFSIDPHFGDQELYDRWMSGSELHKDQVLFTTEAPMGNVAQIPNSDKYILSQRTIAFVVRNEVVTEDFLATLLRSPKVFVGLSALSSGGTAKGVSQKNLANFNISLPKNLSEQSAIGNYFKKLDTLINQHQQQITKLNNIKQACLSKMFV